MDNSKMVKCVGFGKFKSFKTRSQDKGHGVQFAAFVDRIIDGGKPLIAMDELVNATLATLAAVTSANEGKMVHLKELGQVVAGVQVWENEPAETMRS